MIDTLFEALAERPEVDALVLAGSRTGFGSDQLSDYDVYVYSKQNLSLTIRRRLFGQFASQSEIGNDFFGEGDEMILTDGTVVDVMYRSLSWAYDEVDRVYHRFQANVGYSTAFLHNLKTSSILSDPSGSFTRLQQQLESPYPEALVQNILAKNYPLLRNKLCASYYEQIEHAAARQDLVSQAHRTTALLASYFDILFAVNKQFHPGEKRLIDWVKRTCPHIPVQFEEDLNSVISGIGNSTLLPALDALLDHLDQLLER
ncbi:DUF4037 domain-containing protein [Sphaerochaeta sp.]|uniref:DUF4037 domain-containing protein n=1 Tax=Sphaerochaeta sp. TaxID=1972642 RepID=UPI002FCC2665